MTQKHPAKKTACTNECRLEGDVCQGCGRTSLEIFGNADALSKRIVKMPAREGSIPRAVAEEAVRKVIGERKKL